MSTNQSSLEFARFVDQDDPLRALRDQFVLPRTGSGNPLIYLCGHSLGLQPLAARERVLEDLDDWGRLAVLGHSHARRPWIGYHEQLTSGLQLLTGALPSEVVAMNSLTINLHLMLATFYRPQNERRKILIEAGAFSSDRHAVAAQIEWHGLDPRADLIELAPRPGEDIVREEDIESLLARQGSEIALVLWPGVQFRTGQAFDVTRITRAAQKAGCVAGWDLAHAIGNIPLSLHDANADFAVWCSYKYLNAGPGAIGGCFIHERHATSITTPRLSGWWGHEIATRFQMKPGFRAELGAAGWQVSNPPILSAAPLVASLELFEAAGVERLRMKSVALSEFFDALLKPLQKDVQQVTPHTSASRGCQVSLRILGAPTRGKCLFDWLGAQGAICDWREPDIIRAAPIPLYNSFEDVFRFVELLKEGLRLE